MDKKHFEIRLNGKVQGVGFRYSAKEEADKLNIYGYARNLRDGSVVIVVEGQDSSINQFIKWLKSSPGLSEVKESEINESEIKGYREFQIF